MSRRRGWGDQRSPRTPNQPMPAWERYLEARFPAYLLPQSGQVPLDRAAAARFLSRLGGRGEQLDLLRGAHLLARRGAALRTLVMEHLPALCRVLPSRSERTTRTMRGSFSGALDVRGTLALQQTGRRDLFVVRQPRRSFALPENLLLRALAERLHTLLHELRAAGLTPTGFLAAVADCEDQLALLLSRTALREVPLERIGPYQQLACRRAGHPVYHRALEAWGWLEAALDDDRPEALARLLAEGGLTPLSAATRFELAVLVRLIEGLDERLAPAGWSLERAAILPDRKEVARFTSPDGQSLALYYNQAILQAAERKEALAHYFRSHGRMRPDITLVHRDAAGTRRAVVMEVKLSDRTEYLTQGFEEAVLYRWEFREHLTGWPKAVLITSTPLRAGVRPGDDVIAVSWDEWVPDEVLTGLISGGWSG